MANHLDAFVHRLRELTPPPVVGCYTPAVIGQLLQSLAQVVFEVGGTLCITAEREPPTWRELALRHAPPAPIAVQYLDPMPTSSATVLVAVGAHHGYVIAIMPTDPVDHDPTMRLYDLLWSSDPTAFNLFQDSFTSPALPNLHEQFAALHTLPMAVLLRLVAETLDFSARQHAALGVTNRSLSERLHNHEDQTRMIVHDMRAPLHTLLISIKALQRQRFDPEGQQELLSVATDSANYLLNLTETVLDSARLETSSWSLKRQPIRIATLIRAVCEPLELAARPGQPTLRRLVDEDLPVVLLDRALMERVLTNLITNAIKYTPPTGEIVVRAHVASTGHALELNIQDNGAGIPDEALAHIFERFYQARADDHRKGSGLGLYFCRLAVEAHGGSIAVSSVVGQGSTFTLLLPFTEPEAA
jgi:signal transduction histidine kinase